MTRRFRTAILLAAALLAAPRPAPAAAGEASPYGVNAHAPEGEDLRLLLDLAQAARLGWIRIDFIWSWVEPARGARDWRVYDGIVAEARARGIEVYASLVGTPAWATWRAVAVWAGVTGYCWAWAGTGAKPAAIAASKASAGTEAKAGRFPVVRCFIVSLIPAQKS